MSDDHDTRPEQDVLETLDYDATLAKLGAWQGRQVSVLAIGPETDLAFAHLSAEGVLGAVIRIEQPRGVDGVMVSIGEAREGFDNCAHPSYLTISRELHVATRLERWTHFLPDGLPNVIDLLDMDFGGGFRLQVTVR